MNEPTHSHESRFWDQVTDWLMGEHDPQDGPLSEAEIHALLRNVPEGD